MVIFSIVLMTTMFTCFNLKKYNFDYMSPVNIFCICIFIIRIDLFVKCYKFRNQISLDYVFCVVVFNGFIYFTFMLYL